MHHNKVAYQLLKSSFFFCCLWCFSCFSGFSKLLRFHSNTGANTRHEKKRAVQRSASFSLFPRCSTIALLMFPITSLYFHPTYIRIEENALPWQQILNLSGSASVHDVEFASSPHVGGTPSPASHHLRRSQV